MLKFPADDANDEAPPPRAPARRDLPRCRFSQRTRNHQRSPSPPGPRKRFRPRLQGRSRPPRRDAHASPPHDYLYISIGPADVSNEVEGKPPVELKLHDGQTGFLAANFAHIARNLASTPFRNVTIELLQDEKSRTTSQPKWEEERGLNVLQGGTQQILFVKDGARISEIELQPGGMIPSHHHNGPHLVVAVTDLDMRSDIEGRGPTPSQLKSGEVKWVPGRYTHTLTNVAKQPAKFVTVEFP